MTRSPRSRRIAALVLPFLLLAAALPAFGFWGDAGIILNQVIQIGHQVADYAEQIANGILLENQLNQMTDGNLGKIGELVLKFDQLATTKARLMNAAERIEHGDGWYGDFTGDPHDLASAMRGMSNADGASFTDHWRAYIARHDTVSREDMANAFPDLSDEAGDAWLAAREQADRQRIQDYATIDAAERLVELLSTAQQDLDRARQQTNLSNTALQQEQLANQLTQTELNLAVAQLLANQAVRDAMTTQNAELERLRELDARINATNASRTRVDAIQNSLHANADAFRKGLLLN